MKYNPPIEEKRDCANPDCGKSFGGRRNKKFCTPQCKALHNIKKDIDLVEDIYIPYTITHTDSINPSYYKGDIECIDAIKASMSLEAFKGYLKGNIIKYTWRDKENKKEDLDKQI